MSRRQTVEPENTGYEEKHEIDSKERMSSAEDE
jgi:hypothetical protein